MCDGYVTEKFFNILRADMIPLVMNGADMTKIAPKNSYIDVKDFATIAGDIDSYRITHLQVVFRSRCIHAARVFRPRPVCLVLLVEAAL